MQVLIGWMIEEEKTFSMFMQYFLYVIVYYFTGHC